MNEYRRIGLGLAVGLAAIVAVVRVVDGAERMVLGEFFTSMNCVDCPAADAEVEQLLETYPGDFAVVEYHFFDQFSGPFGDERATLHNVVGLGIPRLILDGQDAGLAPDYGAALDSRLAVPTDVSLSVGAAPLSGLTYRVSVRCCVEAGGAARDLRLHTVVVEDHVPAGENHFRNTFRTAAVSEDVTLAEQECHRFERDVTLEDSWSQADLRIISWAEDPSASGPVEVHAAAKDVWPFDPLPASSDWDNDGDVDLDDFDAFLACVSGPAPETPPSPPCLEAFDSDDDDDVDAEDFGAFQQEYTGNS